MRITKNQRILPGELLREVAEQGQCREAPAGP